MVSAELLNTLMERGIFVSPDIASKNYEDAFILDVVNKHAGEIDCLDEQTIRKFSPGANESGTSVKVTQSYSTPPKKRLYQDFVDVFNMRYRNLSAILKGRQELQNTVSISRLSSRAQDRVSVIGMVLDKSLTKNNAIVIKLEDLTGSCTAIIRKDENNKEIYAAAQDVVLDEVVGVVGKMRGDAIFAERIIYPDVPLNKELKKLPDEEYVALLGDTHFGSKKFMNQEFSRFIAWITGQLGSDEQREIASKTRYVILTGDIVEGIGVYPDQEENLSIPDIVRQYEEAANWLGKIPPHIQLIIQCGDHDAGRISEPQEVPFKDLASALWKIPNATLVSNPSYVNIAARDGFPGFDILLYHGRSLIYYSGNVQSIRDAGGQKRCDLILKFLLQRRHLAPTHGSNLYIPDSEKDYLLIDPVPDIFVTGHIHRSAVSSYRNVTTINASCWTHTSEDQIKRGLQPLPARLPVINLKTREVKVMNFLTKQAKEEEEQRQRSVKELEKAS